MKTLAFITQKGGVAKTTSSLNVGRILASQGKSTLLVDMDHQCNLSGSFEVRDSDGNIRRLEDSNGNIYDFLMKNEPPVPIEVAENLFLLPGCTEMSSFDSNLLLAALKKPEDVMSRLNKRISEYQTALRSKFEYIIFDCPPKLDYVTLNVMNFVEWLFIPVAADKYSVDAISHTCEAFATIRNESNPKLKIGGIFFIRYDPRPKLNRKFWEIVEKNYGDLLMKSYTRENVSLRESVYMLTDILEWANQSNGALDYKNITEEIVKVTSQIQIDIPAEVRMIG